jgi:hypothetical protein
MPRVPKATDGEAPKKRVRKSATTEEGTTKVTTPVKAAAKSSKIQTVASAEPTSAQTEIIALPPIEERVRFRAYQLYLRRGGIGGSPEQDWFQALSEIRAESVA